jgi:hypothetical protein
MDYAAISKKTISHLYNKFVYSVIRKGARAQEFEIALQWLTEAWLINKVHKYH